jgi:uncharacterized membrane protein
VTYIVVPRWLLLTLAIVLLLLGNAVWFFGPETRNAAYSAGGLCMGGSISFAFWLFW